ncbi:MAG: DMT family transporter [Bacteroidota bacterium]|nr:DMT family transporter [Bacteroidota bacterium]
MNFTFAKDVMPNFIQPSGFILLRVIGAVTFFSLFYFLFVNEKVAKNDVIRLAICAVFGVAINQLLFFEGLNLTTPINAAIIMTINPVLVLIMSSLILIEKINIKKGVGIALGLLGASNLILNGGNLSGNGYYMWGNLFVFINAASYGLYLVLVKPLMQRYHPITVMLYVFSFGLLYVLPFGYNELTVVQWNSFSSKIIWEVVFVVVCTTFIAYLLNSYALKSLNPSTVSIYIYLQPVLATLFAIFRGSDSLDEMKIISALIIFFGVYLVSVLPLKEKRQKVS